MTEGRACGFRQHRVPGGRAADDAEFGEFVESQPKLRPSMSDTGRILGDPGIEPVLGSEEPLTVLDVPVEAVLTDRAVSPPGQLPPWTPGRPAGRPSTMKHGCNHLPSTDSHRMVVRP